MVSLSPVVQGMKYHIPQNNCNMLNAFPNFPILLTFPLNCKRERSIPPPIFTESAPDGAVYKAMLRALEPLAGYGEAVPQNQETALLWLNNHHAK